MSDSRPMEELSPSIAAISAAARIRVVIVDDMLDTRTLVRKLLQFERDIDVVGLARSPDESIRLAWQLDPDVILMDILMPRMTGLAAAAILGELGVRAQVVLMTVNEDTEIIAAARMLGVPAMLIKPFSGEEASNELRRVHRKAGTIGTHPVVRNESGHPLPDYVTGWRQVDGRYVAEIPRNPPEFATRYLAELAGAGTPHGRTVLGTWKPRDGEERSAEEREYRLRSVRRLIQIAESQGDRESVRDYRYWLQQNGYALEEIGGPLIRT